MKSGILLLSFCMFICSTVHSQGRVGLDAGGGFREPPVKKQIKYQTWIRLNNNPLTAKGILYQVSDSSVFLVNSPTEPEPREYKFSTISLLKIQRYRSVLRGTVTGGTIGFTGGVILVNSFGGGLSFMTVPVSTITGFTFGLFGAGIGALAGTIKDRIPVRGDMQNFSKYKGSLLNYSWMRESITGPRFEHRGYIGAEMGISFAGDEFIALQRILIPGYSRMYKTGIVMVTHGGYRFNEILGMDISLINQMYGVNIISDNNPDNETYNWSFDALIFSPVVSLPSSGKLLVSLSPGIGYAGTTFANSKDFLLNSNGFGWQLRGSMIYNYSKRWFASFSSGYLASSVRYDEGGIGNPKSFHIEAGLSYKFGAKNLHR